MPTPESELLYPTEFFFLYAVKPGHVALPTIALMDIPLGEPCFLCGRRDFSRGVPKKQAIKSNFTDLGYCHHKGNYVCEYCASTVTDAARKVARYCVMPTGMLKKDLDLGALINNPPPAPYLLALGDGQKHTVYKGKVTISKDLIYIYDIKTDRLIDFDRKEAIEVAGTIKHLAAALKSTPYGVAKGNFGSKRLESISDNDRKFFAQFTQRYSFDSGAVWAALKILAKQGGKHGEV